MNIMPNTNLKIYDWVHMAQSYLYSAGLLCDAMVSSKRNIAGSFFPTMYLTKHGIEVFIKMAFVILDDELDRGHRHHDSKKLFEKLGASLTAKRTLIERGLSARLTAEQSLSQPDSGKIANLEVAIKILHNLARDIDHLLELVSKYRNCEIVVDKLSPVSVQDPQNDFFRFPDNTASIDIDYDRLLESLSVEDFQGIKSDIEWMYKTFNGLGFLLDIYKQS